jgi:hypothetical protein
LFVFLRCGSPSNSSWPWTWVLGLPMWAIMPGYHSPINIPKAGCWCSRL